MSVTITRGAMPKSLAVDVRDTSIDPHLSVQNTCFFGSDGAAAALIGKGWGDGLSAVIPVGADQNTIGGSFSEAAAVVRAGGVSTGMKRGSRYVSEQLTAQGSSRVAGIKLASQAAAALAEIADYTLFPHPGVTLQLFGEWLDGNRLGAKLKYQRIRLSDGKVLADQFLSFRPQVA